ncbi:MAG: glycosyltransferase family 4 protein [Lishizhenia sp.]
MRVCHITSVHNQYDSRILYKECKSIADVNHEVTFLVINGKTELLEGVNIIGVPFVSSGRINRILNAGKTLLNTALNIDADIYHLHDPELLRIAVKLKRKSGAKVIYDSHEDLPKQVLDKHWIPKFMRKKVSYFVNKYELSIAKKIDGIVSVTDKICNRFKVANPNVVLVANYPIIKEFDKYKKKINKQPNSICYIGGISEERGIKELVQALPNTNAKLLLAGNFFTQELEKQVKAMDGWKQVEYFGVVNREKIVEILQLSQLGIVALHPTESYKESLPIKMFEYMLASIPFVASNFKFWEDIIFKSNCGLTVDPLNIEEIASNINQLLNNKEKAIQLGENGRKAIEEKYSWDSQAENLLGLYDSLV